MSNINQYSSMFDDGTREITLRNLYGKVICQVHFRPADWSILDRLESLRTDFPEIVKPLEKININANGTASVEKDWATMKSVQEALIDRLNQLFDMDDCGEIFKNRSAFSSVNGKFYAEIVIETLGNIVLEAVEKEMKASKARTDKYLKDLEPEAISDAGAASEDA